MQNLCNYDSINEVICRIHKLLHRKCLYLKTFNITEHFIQKRNFQLKHEKYFENMTISKSLPELAAWY